MDNSEPAARHFIAGRWRTNTCNTALPSINPADGSVVGRVSDADLAEVEEAVACARECFDKSLWPQSPRLRQMVLLRWADRCEREIEPLAELLTLTNGKPLAQSRGELAGAISEIRYYAGLARYNPGSAMEVAPGEFSTMLREPAGVAGLIIPWNTPAVLLVRALASALAVGCAVVVKPAIQTAIFSTEMLASLVDDADLPAGTVNIFLESGHEGSRYLVKSDAVDVISFTGSTAVGQQIMADAAASVKKLSLELGGKSCCLVMQDAHIEAIAPKLAAAATIISGQQCTAARRILVQASRYQEMKSALAGALSAIRIGDGRQPDTMMGPLIDMRARDSVSARIEEAFDTCDEVILRGSIPDSPQGSAFLAPSLIAHGDENADFCQEEIFGPLLVIEPFDTETDAMKKANNTIFGLSASVWTERNDVAWRCARALRNGTVWINDHNKLFAEAETGGYRRSGLGRLHGYDAMLDFTELKHVYQNVGWLSE